MIRLSLCFAGLFITFVGASARGQVASPPLLRDVHLDQNINQSLPLDATFADETGAVVCLRDLVSQRPALLIFAYFTCPNLCTMHLRHVVSTLNGVTARAGQDFDVIVISIDPAEQPEAARRMKNACVSGYHYSNSGNGWHFLTGSASNIQRVTELAGFHAIPDAVSSCWVHPLGTIIISPGGALSHYFYGIDISSADLAAAIADSAAGRSSTVNRPDQQYCLTYTPSASRYGRRAVHCLQILAAAWVILVACYIGRQLMQEHRRARPASRTGGGQQ